MKKAQSNTHMSKIMGCKTLQKSFQSKYILELLFVIHLYLYVLSDILDTVQKKHFQKRIKKKSTVQQEYCSLRQKIANMFNLLLIFCKNVCLETKRIKVTATRIR